MSKEVLSMKHQKKLLMILILLINIFINNFICKAQVPDTFFTAQAPDALIILDLSASMLFTPAGEVMYTHTDNQCDSTTAAFYSDSGPGHDKICTISLNSVPKYSDATCSGPFYRSPTGSYTTDCSRLAIAKRVIFDILDDNDDGSIDIKNDESSLNIRFGYMKFYNCTGEEGVDYNSGCIRLINEIGTKYNTIWNSINSEVSAGGATPLVSALNEAKSYLDYHKSRDSYGSCRQKFVLLITDGEDTLACGGNGTEIQSDQYIRRREVVAKAKELATAGYKVFVIGFGSSMPYWLKNTLNWMAYHGGTDNPLEANSGDANVFSISSVTSCQSEPDTNITVCSGDGGSHYCSTSNDPGELTLSGYAFLASNANQLASAMRQAIAMMREANYSFSLASISSQRTKDENYLYEASFQPISNDPFWKGYLKKYRIEDNGSVGSVVWDAGSVLQSTAASSRTIKTLIEGSLIDFTTSIDKAHFDVSTDTARNSIVGYIHGESASNPDNWKLGDIYLSNPVTIGTPSPFFTDKGYDSFRIANERTSENGKRIVVVGANDGQLHAFKTSDGSEAWSFIPPNLLPKLKNIAHSSHPTGLLHQYFVDGPVTVADVWLGSGNGENKNSTDWKTILIFGEGQGGSSTLWSSSPNCDSGFRSTYSSSYPYYCGYYAFDVTNTLNPVFKWIISPDSSLAPYLGQPWSRFAVGRVKIGTEEKWVGFVGAGYDASDCKGGGVCITRGKGFYVVDLNNGSVLWSYTRANNSNMDFSLPGSPAIVDTDNDGFIDTAYIGDIGGNMWRFKFCTKAQAQENSCNVSNWSGGSLYDATGEVIRPIFGTPAVAKDVNGNLWVYWGTGDKTNPTAPNAQEVFFAVKDNDRTTTYSKNDLDNITSGTYSDAPNKKGWYINITGSGEKILSDPAVFGGVIYFTTYTPHSTDKCSVGTAKLYGVNYTTGAGVFTTESGGSGGGGGGSASTARSIDIGPGIATTPVISFKPGGGTMPADLYVTVSGGSGASASTQRVNFDPPTLASRTNILYWKDRRLE